MTSARRADECVVAQTSDRLVTAWKSEGRLDRITFKTSRELEFASRKELIAQTGHQLADWPLVLLKELIDNGMDAAEEPASCRRSSCRPTRTA